MSTAQNPTPQVPPARITTYREAHPIYRAAGWTGPLPLPKGVKTPPPDGWTGWHGAYPSFADSEAWCDPHDYGDTHQTALRMADGVVGIDVDHYGIKCGADTIAEAARRWGPLPLAPSSSARGAGPSGIHFLRVPPGTVLRTTIGFPELDLGGVEIIQRHHRYAMVWPSTNPQVGGAPYLWRDTGDPFAPPRVAGLPHLPDTWVEALRSTGEPGEAAADPETVTAFSRDHSDADRSASLGGPVAIFKRDATAGRSRHDAMVDAACMAAREARAGAYPAAEARTVLREEFILALAEARAGQRLVPPAAARREFESLWGWAVGQALAMSVGECRARIKWQEPAEPLGPPSPASAPSDAGAETSGGEDGSSDPDPGEPRGEATEDTGTPDAEEIRRRRHADAVAERLRYLRAEAEARSVLAAETREPLKMLDFADFLASPPLEYLVPGFLYRNSTAKIYGPPGGTKSYFLLDLALALAAGRSWHGQDLDRTRVHYVMAEGQAVNALRTLGWLTHHGIDPDELGGWFTAIPQGVLLTPEGVADYLATAKLTPPGLIILDTKNRMMVGEENSASDVAVMVRAMDAIRETCGACVALVDHTGLTDQTRGRGSNAVTAAMDSEIRVMRDETGVATAEVTRDKGGVPGVKVAYQLVSVPDVDTPAGVKCPAVPIPHRATEFPLDERKAEAHRTWADPSLWELPTDVLKLTTFGNGKSAISDVARYMRFAADDERSPGRSRAEMVKDVMKTGRYKDDKVLRDAWSRLVAEGRIVSKTKSGTAASTWEPYPGDPTAKETA